MKTFSSQLLSYIDLLSPTVYKAFEKPTYSVECVVKNMNKPRFLSVWQILVLAVILLLLFMFFIPFWIRRFDVYVPFAFTFGVFKYTGAVIFLVALSFCLYSVFFWLRRLEAYHWIV